MILLRYGIRCTLHYSVPLTLGLLAYTGSWQNVARDLLSEKDAANTSPPVEIAAVNKPANPGPKDESTSDGAKPAETDPPAPPATPRGDESLAMNPAPGDGTPRSLTIPRAQARAVPKEPADSDRRSDDSGRDSIDDARRIRDGSPRPPRDRSIDATGHESPMSNEDRSRSGGEFGPGSVAGAAALALAAAEPRAVTSSSPRTDEKGDATDRPKVDVAKTESQKESPDPTIATTGTDAPEPMGESTPQVTAVADSARTPAPNSPMTVDSSTANGPLPAEEGSKDSGGIEPAHLNPKIREIAAAVPGSAGVTGEEKPLTAESEATTASTHVDSKPEIPAPAAPKESKDSKESLVEAVRPELPAQAKTPEPAVIAEKAEKPSVSERRETANSKKSPTLTNDVAKSSEPAKDMIGIGGSSAVPEFVVAKEGETWERIAQRIFGDESLADSLWKENRDAHGASAETPPIAGRMIRLPDLAKRSGKVPHGETHLARTAR